VGKLMPKTKSKYTELSIYSAMVSTDDFKKFFDRLVRRKVPIFEFVDFSRWFSLKGVNLVVKRFNNTIKLYIEDTENLYDQSGLFFPFSPHESTKIDLVKSHFWPAPKFISGLNMFDFMIKEDVYEIRIKLVKLFGVYYALGNYVGKDGKRSGLYLANPLKFLEIDLESNPQFYVDLLDPVPKMIYFNSEQPIFSKDGVNIGIDNFSAFQHGLIVGTSGSGKSKFLEVLVNSIRKKHGNNVRILVVDPHGEFAKSFKGVKVVNFVENYVEPFDVGSSKSPLIAQLVAQLITSTIGQESRYAERVVFYAVHLLTEIEELTMENINLLLTDSSKRMEFTAMCQNDEVKRFFDKEFQDIYMHHFNDAILPVTNFIGEYMLYLGKDRKLESLDQLISNNQVTVVSFNPHYFGRNIIKFFAGAIINQMYLMAISEKIKVPTILVVDEFPTVESKVVKDILAETRKFQLFMYASAQYLGQLSKPVLDALISNARNIIAFKVTKEDARLLSSMMEIKVEEFFKKAVSPSELEESKREMFVKLHTQECIVRLFDGKKYILPMKVKVVNVDNWRDQGNITPVGTVIVSSDDADPKQPEPSKKTEFDNKGPL
jgi:hypothetical protein